MDKIYDIYTMEMLIAEWQDNKTTHKAIHDKLCKKLQEQPDIWALREYVEKNAFGFGEKSFYPMWQMLVSKMQDNFYMLEVGVFRGQTLALVRMLANKDNKRANIYGVTPLDTTDGHWESDYAKDIATLHNTFGLEMPMIFKGLSTEEHIIRACGLYDILFLDGGHSYEVIKSDLKNYCPKVKRGGYLVIDDCCNNMDIPFGMFGGIASVTKAVEEYFPNEEFEFLFNVVHNRVYRKL